MGREEQAMTEPLTTEMIARLNFYALTYEDFARLCDAALKGVEPGWRPIESAPKDGTRILLYGPPETFEGVDYPDRIVCGEWIDGMWMTDDGGFRKDAPPTYWQPVDLPPSKQEVAGASEDAKRLAECIEALNQLLEWNEGIAAGRGNFHVRDHIKVICKALKCHSAYLTPNTDTEDESNIIDFNGTTTVWEPPDSVLEKAKGQFQDGSNVLIVGWGKDGELWFGGNFSNLAEIVLLLELAKREALHNA